MAIGTPVALGQNSTSVAATTLVITTTVAVAAGDMIFLEIANHNNVTPTSVADSAGNSYTLVNAANGTTVNACLAYVLNAAALANGGTITVTWPSSRNSAAAAYSVSGIATTGAADQQATNTSGSGTAASVGPTGTTTQADELVIGIFGYSSARTFTPGTGYTGLATVESTGTIRGICGEYKIVAATGTQTPGGTFNTSTTYSGIAQTFKGASSTALAATGSIAITGVAALTVTGGVASLAATGSISIVGTAALVFPLAASGSIGITGVASLVFPPGAAGPIAITGSALLSASFQPISGSLAITGVAALPVTGGLTQLAATGTIRITTAAAITASGGPVVLAATGTIRITGSATILGVTGGGWFALMSAGPSGGWHWTRFKRPLLERYLNITLAASGGLGYLGVSTDGVTYTWFSGPLGLDGRTLTAVADETAAQAAAIALPANGVWSLPTTTEARVFKLGHKASIAAGYQLYEFYPRRLVEADDIRAETIQAIHIAAGTITGDRIFATAIDGFTVTGSTIRTAATGARVVLSSAANGGLIGYGASDTFDPATGTGTYQILWKKTDGKLYWANGIGALGDSGVVFSPVHNGDETKNGLGWQNGGQVQAVVYGDVVVNSMAKVEIKAAYNGVFGTTNPRITMNDYAGTFSGMIEFDSTWTYLKLAERGAYLKYGLLIDGDGSIGYQSGQVYGLQVSNGGINIDTTGAATGELRASGKLYSPAVVLQSDAGDGSATTAPGQLGIVGATNPNLLGLIGFDTTTKQLYIQALENGVAWKNIILANNGGSVGIGSTSPSEKLAVSGNVNISGVYKCGGLQLLTTRRTGWGTPTGTLYRTALTNDSTQTQFNQAIMAAITDLITHGLLGA